MTTDSGLSRTGRAWHAVTAVVTAGALVLQLVLVLRTGGAGVPPLGTRLLRFGSYFTVQSNLGVMLTTASLALAPGRDGWWWRVLRLDAVAGITVTGVVHLLFLRPDLHLHGAQRVADELLHVAVPLLAVLGWLLFGPRRRVDAWTVPLALVWPVLFVVGTGLHGAATHWYPYPFADVGVLGYPTVLRNSVAVLLFLLAVCLLLLGVDTVLGRRRPPRERPTYTARP